MFQLEKNIHMFCHMLHIQWDGEDRAAIVESAAGNSSTLLIWLDDFGLSEDEQWQVRAPLSKWLLEQGLYVVFCEGDRVQEPWAFDFDAPSN